MLVAMLTLLAGCGAGGGTGSGSCATSAVCPASNVVATSTQTIKGVVATGNPLAATITIKDSTTGTPQTATGKSSATDGSYSIPVTGMTPPFMLVAVPASGSNLYSILPAMNMTTNGSQNVNITPVTTLVMYELNGGADPASMFGSGAYSTVTAASVAAKQTIVRGKLPANANTPNPIFDMMYGVFTPTGASDPTGYDTSLDNLGSITNIASAKVTFSIAPPYTSVPVVAGTPLISLTVNNPNTGTSTISSNSPATATATLDDANNQPVPNAVVTFTTDATLATMTPTSGTAITNASGVAAITLNPASITASGAATLTASAQVGSTPVTKSTGYSVGATTLTITAPCFGSPCKTPTDTGQYTNAGNALSAFGNTSVTVFVASGGIPINSQQVVTFSSSCIGSGQSKLASVTTGNTGVAGMAVGSYTDIGCTGSDTITASVGSLTTPQSSTIYLTTPTAGSIQYVSATPASISLAGTGGTSVSQVAFKVVDGGGNPLSGQAVTFGLSTTVGGITLTPAITTPATTVTSDSNGMVYVNVNAGTVSTPVRVTATTCTNGFTAAPPTCNAGGTTLATQSSQLTITTGIPSQSSMTLSATTLNIEGWDYDGTTTILTAFLADHFGNPVPDGSAVNFVTEGARVGGSCVTSGGNCTVTFNSQNIRPSDGRVTVLAYAVGEESFIDRNGNGVADLATTVTTPSNPTGNEMIDINGNSTDMPEAWVDYNENGKYDKGEPYIDFNNNGAYDAADGQYNGVLCNVLSSAGTCSTTKTIDVRQDIVIVLSGSTPVFTISTVNSLAVAPALQTVDLTGCGGPQTINVKIVDVNGNLMPAGTTVTFAANHDGTILSMGGNLTVENANTEPTGFPTPPTPARATIPNYNYSVTFEGDGAISSGVCTDTTLNGTLTVTVTTPKGITTTKSIANLIN